MRMKWRGLGLGVSGFILFGVLLGGNPAWGSHGGITVAYELFPMPSFLTPEQISEVKNRLGCTDAFTGKLLDCHFEFRITGLKPPPEDLKNSGYHNHNPDTHPLIEPPQPPLGNGQLGVIGGEFAYTNSLEVKGQTRGTMVQMIHPIPQVAGIIETEILIDAPPGYQCGFPCYTHTRYRAVGKIDVGVGGLVRLEDSGLHHVVVRDGKDTHPEGTHGMADTLETLKKIAQKYFEVTNGRRLSVNDLSLPRGGVFDICNTYNPTDTCASAPKGGHFEHRVGKEADLNSKDEGGVIVDCNDLREIIKLYIPLPQTGGKEPLKCHPGGGFHVRFN